MLFLTANGVSRHWTQLCFENTSWTSSSLTGMCLCFIVLNYRITGMSIDSVLRSPYPLVMHFISICGIFFISTCAICTRYVSLCISHCRFYFNFPQIDIIGAMMIVWRARGKIIMSVLCSIVCNNCTQWTAHTFEQNWQFSGLGFVSLGPFHCA